MMDFQSAKQLREELLHEAERNRWAKVVRATRNGRAGRRSNLDGELYAICALTVQGGRITTMDILLDPERLARLDLPDFETRL